MNRSVFEVTLTSVMVAYCAPAYAVQYATASEAQKIFFPTAASFEMQEVLLDESRTQYWKALSLQAEVLGYFFVDNVIGKHELITYAVAFSTARAIMGVEVLEYRENRGDEIVSPAWRKQFIGRTANDVLSVGDDIQNITGATLSCIHVTEGIKRLAQILERSYDKNN